VAEIAEMRDQDWIDTVIDLCLSEEKFMGHLSGSFLIFTVFFIMQEENIRRTLQQPWIKISTDAGGYDPTWAKEWAPVHPRSYGTYPRVLGKYYEKKRC
jgi:N-acyl-D-aspartate/D-glutamate deacylase